MKKLESSLKNMVIVLTAITVIAVPDFWLMSTN